MLRRGFEIGIAKNAVEALKILNFDIFDLVITDFQMPNMDGHTLACHIRRKNPRTVIFMMSGNKKICSQVKNVADHFFEKPFILEEMAYLMDCAFGLENQKLAS